MGVCMSDQKPTPEIFQGSNPELLNNKEQKQDEELAQAGLKIQTQFRTIQAKKLAKAEQEQMEAAKPSPSYAIQCEPINEMKSSKLMKIRNEIPYEYSRDYDAKFPEARMLKPYVLMQSQQKILENDSIYEGQWVKGVRNGRGKCQYADGSIYEGYWKDNKEDIHGRLLHYSGDYYQGSFHQGTTSGNGFYQYLNSYRLQGKWQNGQFQDGEATEIWPNGYQYKSTFKGGQKQGKGRGTRSDGEVTAEYQNDKLIQAEIIFTDGRTYSGEIKGLLMHGRGELKWPNKAHFIGIFEEDLQQGTGTFYDINGLQHTGFWEKGQLHGKQIINGTF